MPSSDLHSAPSTANASAPFALEVRDLAFSYGGFDVFRDVSFSLKAGELAFLMGENGSGKSTLLRCLAGWADPTGGIVFLQGAPFDTSDRCQRRKVAFVPDSPAFYDDLTADEHLAFVRQANRIDAEDDLLSSLMERIGLAGYGGKLPSLYSRGMRMKLAPVMAFAAKPSLLLLDEPHGPLDPDAAAVLGGMVRDALDAGTAVLISCHHDVPGLQPDKVLRPEAGSLILWLAMPQLCIRDMREIARCFRDDLRLRCVRDRLPLATAAIFALDVLPFLAVVLSVQAVLAIASFSLAIALGTSIATALPVMICLTVLLTVGLTLCCAFDAVRMPFGARREVGCEWAAFAFAGATAAAAMIGLPPLLLAAFVAALDVALAAGIARVLR